MLTAPIIRAIYQTTRRNIPEDIHLQFNPVPVFKTLHRYQGYQHLFQGRNHPELWSFLMCGHNVCEVLPGIWLKETAALNTVLFAGDQIIIQEREDKLQRSIFYLNNI
jgi:hypothetical protein